MKQIITLKLHMHGDGRRCKAMAIATQADGTITCVKIEGPERDRLVITGEDVDPVKLTQSLRKKFPEASIERVEPVIDGKNDDDNNNDNNYNRDWGILRYHEPYYNFPHYNNTHFIYEGVPVYDPNPPICNIM